MEKIIQIRWHGRGGQGSITAAKIVARAAYESGYHGAVMIPTFGTERRGAPVITSLKISEKKIYDLSPIQNPDIVVILDHLLFDEAVMNDNLSSMRTVIMNTPISHLDYNFNGTRFAVADINSIAEEAGLQRGVINSGIIGLFARASDIIDINILIEKIKEEFHGRMPIENARAAILAYEKAVSGGE
jgi:2-oxoacid:acceptor oxidoreductase gamma subunit (pyruvate/2-ketoisovalerate family)